MSELSELSDDVLILFIGGPLDGEVSHQEIVFELVVEMDSVSHRYILTETNIGAWYTYQGVIDTQERR